MPREALTLLQTDDLQDEQLSVTYEKEVRQYRLIERVGEGQTAVAWRATDSQNRNWVLKFSLREEYHSHSLESEIARVNKLKTELVARIDFFGVPATESGSIDLQPFYAIVVEWVDGITLCDFLRAPGASLTVDAFCQMARDLCEILKCLADCSLSHSDLHDRNIMVRVQTDPMSSVSTRRVIAIDTGQLKSVERRSSLLEKWNEELSCLEEAGESPAVGEKKARLKTWVSYFSRTDHEWVVKHLCDIYNAFVATTGQNGCYTSFVRDIPAVLEKALDPDPTARLHDPVRLYKEIVGKVPTLLDADETNMQSPFDLPSAELIRSDRQLMSLFSDEYPRLDECRSNSPVYIYGPRGCGKSTILRSMSLGAILKSNQPESLLSEVEFIGTYISCSTEFRSRFWLFDEADFTVLGAHIVRYFSLLLIEGLCETLDSIFQWDQKTDAPTIFGMTEDTANQCVRVIQEHLSLPESYPYYRTSPFAQLRLQTRGERDRLWKLILDRSTPSQRPNAQLIFDVARDLEAAWPFLGKKRLAFLIDDYSNQRIPASLQRRLNQAITFAKQSNPIFKVSSEYFGVDLDGIQEGREVREVNIGSEYVALKGKNRWAFLCQVLDRRFEYKNVESSTIDILPLSQVSPTHDMASRIRGALESDKKFYYHGIDTISDVCSGDFATGLDIVRKMFEKASVSWEHPSPIPPNIQHGVITEYSGREHEYIRFRSTDGPLKASIVNSLCWLSKQCVLHRTRKKDSVDVPVVKNHIDISETALADLEKYSEAHFVLLMDLVRKGVLFPLDTSRSRENHQGTRRYMVRRILLARYVTALGRDSPIRIDGLERLRALLTEPKEFVEGELERTGRSAPPPENDPQKELEFGD